MLETVKSTIESLPNSDFNSYYVQYIMSVQDTNIEKELKFLIGRNTLNINVINKVIQNTYKRLVQL